MTIPGVIFGADGRVQVVNENVGKSPTSHLCRDLRIIGHAGPVLLVPGVCAHVKSSLSVGSLIGWFPHADSVACHRELALAGDRVDKVVDRPLVGAGESEDILQSTAVASSL